MIPAEAPIAMAPMGPTLPAAGVIVASPAIVPVTIPTSPGFPVFFHSMNIQTKLAVAADRCVTSIAIPALVSAAPALPALKPNHPTQSMEAPIITIPGL